MPAAWFHIFTAVLEGSSTASRLLQRVLDREAEQHTHELRCKEQNDGVHVAYHDTACDEHDLQRRRDGILEPARKARLPENWRLVSRRISIPRAQQKAMHRTPSLTQTNTLLNLLQLLQLLRHAQCRPAFLHLTNC